MFRQNRLVEPESHLVCLWIPENILYLLCVRSGHETVRDKLQKVARYVLKENFHVRLILCKVRQLALFTQVRDRHQNVPNTLTWMEETLLEHGEEAFLGPFIILIEVLQFSLLFFLCQRIFSLKLRLGLNLVTSCSSSGL